MRSSAITRIVLCSIAILLLLAVLLGGLGLGFAFRQGAFSGLSSLSGGTVESSGAVSAADVQTLEIEWVGGSVTIEPGDGDSIRFQETGAHSEKDTMVWRLKDGTLHLQFCQPRTVWGIHFGNFDDGSKELTITVPKGWRCGALSIASVSAGVSVSRLTADRIDLKNVSGRCDFQGCVAESVSLETVSGNLNYTGSMTTLSCESVSARCSAVLFDTPRSIRMDGVSGDLELTLPEDTGFTASLDTISGSIRSDFEVTLSGNEKIFGDGRCRITANGVSGNIIIKRAQ